MLFRSRGLNFRCITKSVDINGFGRSVAMALVKLVPHTQICALVMGVTFWASMWIPTKASGGPMRGADAGRDMRHWAAYHSGQGCSTLNPEVAWP